MRRARIKESSEPGDVVFHLVSRTVNGEWMLDDTAKEVLRRQIWQVAEFAGLELITYTILSNHFHILVRVSPQRSINDEELLRRYEILYPQQTRYHTARLKTLRAQLRLGGPEAEAWKSQLLSLMNDISQYMKIVKERFSIWYNKSHKRFGPVWSDRFKSLLIEPKGRVVETIAAYIDLNCVRARIASDPKDYRFCGYAEAVAGGNAARTGIRSVIGGQSWDETQAIYRQILYTTGSQPREKLASLSMNQFKQVIAAEGKLPLSDVLRCKIRYFTEGAVLGSQAFVEAQLQAYRRKFGVGQRMKVQSLPSLTDWGELAGLRRLPKLLFGDA